MTGFPLCPRSCRGEPVSFAASAHTAATIFRSFLRLPWGFEGSGLRSEVDC
jgi:hypothetical protein